MPFEKISTKLVKCRRHSVVKFKIIIAVLEGNIFGQINLILIKEEFKKTQK